MRCQQRQRHFIMRMFVFGLCVALVAAQHDHVGRIVNFDVTGNGDGYVQLEWDLEGGSINYPLHKYNLLTDNDFSNDVRCYDPHCTYVVDYLETCVLHLFQLTPYFTDTLTGGPDLVGVMANASGYTQDLPPGAPVNVEVMSDSSSGSTTVQWLPPTENTNCAHYYQVCFRLAGATSSECHTTDTTSYTYLGLEACATYHVTVTAMTASGTTGPTTEEVITTDSAVPGPPKDMVVGLTTPDTIQLLWNDPEQNPMCVDSYVITYGEVHTNTLLSRRALRQTSGYDNEATISPLLPCTNYTIDVYSQNVAEQPSPAVTNYAATAETKPLPPTSVIITPTGQDSMDVTWGENEDDRCAASFEICWTDGTHPVEVCEDVPTGDGGGDNSYSITDLLPCSDYDVEVSVVSPGGNHSESVTNSTTTQDVQPGPVQNLKVVDVSTNQMQISFDPPIQNPQCVKEYDMQVIEQATRAVRAPTQVTPYVQDTISGLEACTVYLVKISAVSPTGLRSPWEQVNDTTSAATPSEPQALDASTVGDTSITMEWFTPAVNPGCVDSYVLTWEGPGANETVTITDVSNFKSQYTVTGLEVCAYYSFEVVAESQVGTSPTAQIDVGTSGC